MLLRTICFAVIALLCHPAQADKADLIDRLFTFAQLQADVELRRDALQTRIVGSPALATRK
jgi:hypothetical protein